MKEQLYSIPVNDAFNTDGECPVCNMYTSLQNNAIEFTMGPSYMEDDVRMETNRLGFCEKHINMMYARQNRLGIALMLHTHMQTVIAETEKLQKKEKAPSGGLFKKSRGKEISPVASYVRQLNSTCYVCDRIENTFNRYINTIFYLFRNDKEFRERFASSKGFCVKHYGILYEEAEENLRGNDLTEFMQLLDRLFLDNMKRVCDDIEWYTDKFDYRNADAPWKNSKDAVPRTVKKLNSMELQE